MECRKYSELISAYMDEMLSQHEKEQLMAHLMVCEKCNEEMKALKQMKSLIEQVESPELPDRFHKELMTRMKQEKPKVVHIFKWKWQYSGALVAALMIGFFGVSQMIPLGVQNKPGSESVTLAEAAPYEMQESAISEASSHEPVQGVQAASEHPNIVGRSRLISEGDEESLQEVRWKINIKEESDFVEQLKIYLESTGISYEIYQEEVICYQVTDYEALMKWIQEQGVECEGEVTKATGNLVIELEQ